MSLIFIHSQEHGNKLWRNVSVLESDSAVAGPRPTLQRDVNYLLAGFDVGVDVLEHRLEHGVVAHAQVLDLDLSVLGPVLGYLGGVWAGGGGGE